MEIDERKEILTLIYAKNGSETKRMYELYREQFFRYGMNRFALGIDILSDIYQDSFMILYDNVRRGKLTNLSCSLKTYLFQIGTNQILSYLKKTNKHVQVPIDHSLAELDSYYSSEEWEQIQTTVFDALSVLEYPCDQILSLYYWEQRKMNDIAGIMGYKNEQVAKNRKSICLKRLKEFVMEKLKKEDLL